jgi:hypothetical protein
VRTINGSSHRKLLAAPDKYDRIMGESAKGQLLVVAYTERAGITRLISARPVTRKERKAYESDL